MLEEQVNRQAVRHMNETMEQLNQIRDYLEREIEAHCRCVVRQEEEGLLLLWDEWMQCDPVIQNGIIQKCLENLAGTGRILCLYTLRQWRSCLKSRAEESEIFPTISVQRGIMKEYF